MTKDLTRRAFLKTSAGIIAGTYFLSLAGCGARSTGAVGDTEYTIKLSHVVAPDTPKGKAAEKFKEVAEQKSDGRITVEVYPNSQLYGDEDELQALQSGAVQMLAPLTSKFTTMTPEFQVLDLPFLFEGPDDVRRLFSRDAAIGQVIYSNEQLIKNNIQVIGLWDNGFTQLTANREIVKPEDMKGLKVRIQPADVIRSYMEAWGANPTSMAWAEVYNALQQGVIDGQENTYSNIYSAKLHSVQSHLTESNHHYLGYVLAINKEFFDNLPEDLQLAVTEAADEATAYNREIALETNERDKQRILEEGIQFIELSPEQRQAFKKQVVPEVWNQFADVIGPDVIQQIKEAQLG
jgi:C4-dicarboxylate-binding protein DctP